jgi:hypothetical protein
MSPSHGNATGGPASRGGVQSDHSGEKIDADNKTALDLESTPITIGELAKNKRERLRVQLKRYKGIDLVDVRVVAPYGENGMYLGTSKGVSIRPALLRELIEILEAAETRARALGLLEVGGSR